VDIVSFIGHLQWQPVWQAAIATCQHQPEQVVHLAPKARLAGREVILQIVCLLQSTAGGVLAAEHS
jgi:hypothetical protein